MNRHRRVAQHGFRARCRDHQMATPIDQGIAKMPKTAFLLAILYLKIRDRGMQYRIPVDEALTAIDQALLVKTNEALLDGCREALIHGEAFP